MILDKIDHRDLDGPPPALDKIQSKHKSYCRAVRVDFRIGGVCGLRL